MNQKKIAIIGLGYVGLPLAVAFAKKYTVAGFDINPHRVKALGNGHDHTLEVSDEELQEVLDSGHLQVTDQASTLSGCNVFIVTVPTPTDKNNRPVLTLLIKASQTISKVLKKGDIVIYESTVYPGVTEEECVPVLEQGSGLIFNRDFFAGYSPERINPGDKEHTVTKILKVTSGSTPEVAEEINKLYGSVITAGTYKASSIRVAEAAKVIENSQRDINIAFVNELAKIFNKMGIDTREVLETAGTKWNFLPFRPGLVGGHCIGVDPYYLAQKAQEVGYHTEILLAGRRLNDSMGSYVAEQTIKLMVKNDLKVKGAKVLVLGITFKENCPDIRNTRVIDIIHELQDYSLDVDIYDPWASSEEVADEYGLQLAQQPGTDYQAIILAVSHDKFNTLDLQQLKAKDGVVYDVKGVLDRKMVDGRL